MSSDINIDNNKDAAITPSETPHSTARAPTAASDAFTILPTRTATFETLQARPVRPPPFSRKVTRALFIRPADTRGPSPGYITSLKNAATYSWINVLLVFNPVSWALYYTGQNDGATFAMALLGIIPLASMLGYGTETIALYTGDALGGLINVTFANATEFIIDILLLVKCEIRVVQASVLGGMLSNLLLVTGTAFIVGGLRFSEQEFQATAAQLNTSLLTLAVIALVIPTAVAFAIEQVSGENSGRDVVLEMSRGSGLILMFIYLSYMVFQLYSHSYLYNPENDVLLDSVSNSSRSSVSTNEDAEDGRPHQDHHRHHAPIAAPVPERPALGKIPPFGSAAALGRGTTPMSSSKHAPETLVARSSEKPEARSPRLGDAARRDIEAVPAPPVVATHGGEGGPDDEVESPEMNLTVAISLLALATGLAYLTGEALTNSLQAIGEDSSSVSAEWLGLVVLAVVGNTAEHVTTVLVAYRNKVDLALAVCVGSSIQIALFVVPILLIVGWIADIPFSLLFDPLQVVVLFLAVLLLRFATEDGRTHYMNGMTLFGTYVIIAFTFWYYPQGGSGAADWFTDCSSS